MTVNRERLLNARMALEGIIEKYDDICDLSIKNLIKQDGSYTSQEIDSHLATLEQEGRNLKVGVIGRVKAGKSSLINAILFDGKEILPKAATPMTAALTSIGYAAEFRAEVRFFNQEDIDDLKSKALIFDREVDQCIRRYRQEFDERMKRTKRSLSEPSEDALRKKAFREVGEDGGLAAAADLYKRIVASSVDFKDLGESQLLIADTVESLNGQLMDFVGADGCYMPFTRELNLGLPLENLKGIEVLDTPGINDPVKSREQRTYDRLKECSAAFIVSPAGQFMSEQDFELAERLSAREGTQEIYIVASQADTQLHSSIRQEAKGVFPKAIEMLHATIAEQAGRALARCDDDVLRSVATDLSRRLILTAGICEDLVHAEGVSDDEATSHVMKLLKQSYPDFFARPEDLMANLKLLSGRDQLEKALAEVKGKKYQILEKQADNFVEAQWSVFLEIKKSVLEILSSQRDEVENGDKTEIQEKLNALKVASEKGIEVSNLEFENQIKEMELRLPADLEAVIRNAMDRVDERTESAEGVDQETRRVESDGVLSWLARKVSMGGYEEHTFEVETVKPLPVRRALEGLARLMKQGLKDCTQENVLRHRSVLISGLSRQVREAIGDENVDIPRLQRVCTAAVEKVLAFPDVDIHELPASLAKSRKIKGRKAEEFIEESHRYASELESAGFYFVGMVRSSIASMTKIDVGKDLMSDLMKEMEGLKMMIENKVLTLEKMSRMQSDIEGI